MPSRVAQFGATFGLLVSVHISQVQPCVLSALALNREFASLSTRLLSAGLCRVSGEWLTDVLNRLEL